MMLGVLVVCPDNPTKFGKALPRVTDDCRPLALIDAMPACSYRQLRAAVPCDPRGERSLCDLPTERARLIPARRKSEMAR